jgi:RimJ/RimL family protein N-acetyltransferase
MSKQQLPPEILCKRELLPEKPSPTTLHGRYVRLEPLVVGRDTVKLFEVSNGSPIVLGNRSLASYDAKDIIWRYLFDGPFVNINDFTASLSLQVSAPNGLCLCVFDVASNQPVGVVNFMNNQPAHLKIELGGIWYSPIVQGTKANTEATYLMLHHAFNLGYRRVEWKCNALNERSRRSALRMGFQFEGIQESHLIIKGYNRDTAWFRLLDTEWPNVKKKLEQMLVL